MELALLNVHHFVPSSCPIELTCDATLLGKNENANRGKAKKQSLSFIESNSLFVLIKTIAEQEKTIRRFFVIFEMLKIDLDLTFGIFDQ